MKIRKRSVPTRRSAAAWERERTSRREVNYQCGKWYSDAGPIRNDSGLTLIELIVIIATIAIIATIILSGTIDPKSRVWRIKCLNNLKEIGLGNRAWSVDQTSFPQDVSETNGGTMELMGGLNAFRAFQNMSNQLIAPELLLCPSDASRVQATTFNLKPLPGAVSFASNSNLSYFVGLDLTGVDPNRILSGDRNIANGTPLKNGILELFPNKPAGWTAEMHNKVGNILLADGSVQQERTIGLRTAVTNATSMTNRLLIPVLQKTHENRAFRQT